MFGDVLRRSARQFRDRPAIRQGDRDLGYAELYDRSCRLANLLAEGGAARGEVVASLGRNRLESLEEFASAAVGGFVRSPLYWQDAPARQVFMLKRTGAAALIVDAEAWPALRAELAAQDHGLKCVLVRDPCELTGASEVAYESGLRSAANTDPRRDLPEDETHVIRFSAGTTGAPKPVAHSERAYRLANQEVFITAPPIDEDDAYLAASPYSHGSGNMVWPFITAGARHVVTNGFDAERALALIEQEACTTLFLVPTMIQRLLSTLRERPADVSSVRRIIYGAAPIPQELIKEALAAFGDVLFQLYGQSEIVPLTALRPREHRQDAEGATGLLRSAGRPTPNSFVRIERDDGSLADPGEIGEVVGIGPGVMQGIYGDPQATAERFTADGWVRTNDLGWMDQNGYLFIADRKDDIIISGGFNIAPAEIEDALTRHPEVVEAVAFGMPHPEWGSAPTAVVRLVAGSAVSGTELIAWCQQAIGSLKKPARILVADEPLPVSAAGKLLRRVAKERYGERLG